MRHALVLAVLALATAVGCAGFCAESDGLRGAEEELPALRFDFDRVEVGTLPAGWQIGGTNQHGPLATWAVVADATAPSAPRALALVSSSHGSEGTLNLCWTDAVRFTDGALELHFKANSGTLDQGGGPIWRVLDENNYLLCRMNPLESNLRVYEVKDGVRHAIASADVVGATGEWHTIRVEQTGAHIVCSLDGVALLDTTSDHLPRAGGVGLWAKADALTSFDNFIVEPEPAALPLLQSATIPMPGVEGRIDHLAIDLRRERLYVAALANNSIEVIDLKSSRVEHRLLGSEPQGILYLADLDRMVVANGTSGTCDVYDGEALERVASIDVGSDADNLRYDTHSQRLYVAVGEALTTIDAQTWRVLDTVALAGHPEAFQLDQTATHAFVNVPDAHHIAAVDLTSHTVTQTWPLGDLRANYPMAWLPGATSEAAPALLVGCRSPAKLLVINPQTGTHVALLDLAADTDDIFFDSKRQRVYSACGAGTIDIFERDAASSLRLLTTTATSAGARTCLFVPERDQLFVAVPHRGEQVAEVRVFDVR